MKLKTKFRLKFSKFLVVVATLINRLAMFLVRLAKSLEYPSSVEEILDDNLKYKAGTLEVMEAFKADKPWKGSILERGEKVLKLYQALSKIYEVRVPQLILMKGAADRYLPDQHSIILNSDKISVLTALHKYGHALGKDEFYATKWSVNLFKRVFPKQYAKLQSD